MSFDQHDCLLGQRQQASVKKKHSNLVRIDGISMPVAGVASTTRPHVQHAIVTLRNILSIIHCVSVHTHNHQCRVNQAKWPVADTKAPDSVEGPVMYMPAAKACCAAEKAFLIFARTWQPPLHHSPPCPVTGPRLVKHLNYVKVLL